MTAGYKDVAPNGAGPVSFGRGYKDVALTELVPFFWLWATNMRLLTELTVVFGVGGYKDGAPRGHNFGLGIHPDSEGSAGADPTGPSISVSKPNASTFSELLVHSAPIFTL